MKYKIRDLCDTISATFDKTKEKVVLINTSDVLEGNVLNHELVINENIKGQFKKTFQTNDILYSEIRPKNKRFAFVDFESEDYVASTKLMVLRANKKILPEFLFQLLKSDLIIQQLQDLAETRSGTFPQITFYELGQIDVDIPDINEQKIISEYIMNYDEKIENNKKINHHLAEMAESIWKEKYANLKPNSTLGNFFPIITGKKDANVARGGQYPFFSCSQGISYTDAYSFEGNAILLAGNGDFNVKTYNGKFEAYQRTYVLIPNNEYRLGFLYYAIKHFLSDITAGDRGSVIKYITKGDIENLNLYMPDDESDFELFNQFVSNTAQNNAEIERLTETRDTLLPKLMSGELSVID